MIPCSHCGELFTFLFVIDGLLSDVQDRRAAAYCERALERGIDPERKIQVWGCVTEGCCGCRLYKDPVNA